MSLFVNKVYFTYIPYIFVMFYLLCIWWILNSPQINISHDGGKNMSALLEYNISNESGA